MTVHDFTATLNDGTSKSLRDYAGKVLLIVNTASECGFTPQYQGLQALYERFRAQGFEILGFPCDQFGHQEPGSDAEILTFCERNYGVTFPLFAKIEVNGAGALPLYQHLKREAEGFVSAAIKWNFTKFLVDGQGRVVERFAPTTTPEQLQTKVAALLGRDASQAARV